MQRQNLGANSLHNHLLKDPDIAYVISTILCTLIGYSLLNFNSKKIVKLHAEQLHAHN